MKRKIITEKVKSENIIYDFKLFGSIYCFFKVPRDFDVKLIVNTLEEKIPKSFFKNLKQIYIGNFSSLQSKGINGLENNQTIYINYSFSSEKEVLKTIIHELIHSVFGNLNIPEEVESEFKNKKVIFLSKVKNSFKKFNNIDLFSLSEDEWVKLLSNNQEISMLLGDLFPTLYSSVNFEEYITSGFEIYYLENNIWLKENCTELYNFINNLINEVTNE